MKMVLLCFLVEQTYAGSRESRSFIDLSVTKSWCVRDLDFGFKMHYIWYLFLALCDFDFPFLFSLGNLMFSPFSSFFLDLLFPFLKTLVNRLFWTYLLRIFIFMTFASWCGSLIFRRAFVLIRVVRAVGFLVRCVVSY